MESDEVVTIRKLHKNGEKQVCLLQTPSVVLCLGLSTREEKIRSGVRLQATVSLSLELEGLGT